MNEEWDTLILLDACRFDDFEMMCNISGNLDYRISKGVDSPSFIEENFLRNEFKDTIYITANPHVHMLGEDVFYRIDTTPLEKWDSNMECVMPEEVTQAALKAHSTHPDKRIIVHYMQPHDPPIGPTGKKLLEENNLSGMRSDVDDRYINALKNGEISKERAQRAYRETLDIVLQEALTLINGIEGKIIISSDHGEMFGEKPYRLLPDLYEHYNNPKTVELCKVPWMEVDFNGERRKISSGEQSENSIDINEKSIEDQLEALGYK